MILYFNDYKLIYIITMMGKINNIPVLNEDVIRLISSKKMEPDWLLEFRLKAFRHWQSMGKPQWAHLDIPEIDYQKMGRA